MKSQASHRGHTKKVVILLLCMRCVANKLRAIEEGGQVEQDPKLAIQASSTNSKAQFGSVEHLQEVENRRAVKVGPQS